MLRTPVLPLGGCCEGRGEEAVSVPGAAPLSPRASDPGRPPFVALTAAPPPPEVPSERSSDGQQHQEGRGEPCSQDWGRRGGGAARAGPAEPRGRVPTALTLRPPPSPSLRRHHQENLGAAGPEDAPGPQAVGGHALIGARVLRPQHPKVPRGAPAQLLPVPQPHEAHRPRPRPHPAAQVQLLARHPLQLCSHLRPQHRDAGVGHRH